ncbi:MAG: HEAT repeat domain-containing protein [Gammaproteobacteria bacterium]
MKLSSVVLSCFVNTIVLFVCAATGIAASAQSQARQQQVEGSTVAIPGSSDRTGSLSPVADGWHTWTVEAVDEAPNWCCITWRKKGELQSGCQLEGNKYSYGISTDDPIKFTDEIRVFAQIENGQTKRVRAFGEQCSVTSDERVIDHGHPGTAASLEWLSAQLGKDRHVTGQSLGVIAAHDSNQAQLILVDSARPNRPLTRRKDAVFWMGQVRAKQSETELTRIMREDSLAKLREHVVFSISQSSLSNKTSLIAQAGKNDESPKVRGQSWFWMAQTEEPDAERRIREGMRSETDRDVLYKAVFALSQLPSDSGVSALISVIEDSGTERRLRKKALFWLAQSSSDEAINYIAEVLNR